MPSIHDGGAAFPRPFSMDGSQEAWSQDGMSLRDYFAAKAMHAELVTAGALPEPAQALCDAAEIAGRTVEEQVAFNAYKVADAMLKERAK